MLTGISPFLGEDKQETFLNISQLNVSYTEEELQQLDQAAVSFIQTLLRKQPQSVHKTHKPLSKHLTPIYKQVQNNWIILKSG